MRLKNQAMIAVLAIAGLMAAARADQSANMPTTQPAGGPAMLSTNPSDQQRIHELMLTQLVADLTARNRALKVENIKLREKLLQAQAVFKLPPDGTIQITPSPGGLQPRYFNGEAYYVIPIEQAAQRK